MKEELKIMSPKVILFCLLHFLVDFICASSVTREVYYLQGGAFFYILANNCLAFLLQPFFGLLVDKFHKKKHLKIFLGISLSMIIFEAITSTTIFGINIDAIIFLGIANALFHVVGGKEVLTDNNKASYGGLFVSTGAIGVGVSVLYRPRNIVEPSLRLLLSLSLVLLVICYLVYLSWKDRENISLTTPYKTKYSEHKFITTAIIVGVAVIIRSMAGFYGSSLYSYEFRGVEFIIIFAIFAFVGKAIGGIILDLAGPKVLIIMSWFISLMCLFSLNYFLLPCLLFSLSINLLMPLTLDIMRRICPRKEGFAFGFTASFLTIGHLLTEIFYLNTNDYRGYRFTTVILVILIYISCALLYFYFVDRPPLTVVKKK